MGGRPPDKIIGERGLGPGQFVRPRAAAAGPDGTVYVVDMTARIQRFSPEGEFQMWWQMPEWDKGKPTGLTVDARGRLLVADTHYHRVIVYDRDGQELLRFGSEGTGPGEFLLTTDVVVDASGNFYVSEYGGNDRVSRFAPDLTYLGSFGGLDAGEASLRRPQSMQIDDQGNLWVVDACNHRVCRFSPDGKLLSVIGSAGKGPGQLQFPYDLALCPDGTLIVSEYGNNRLQRFDRQGNSLEIWGGRGTAPGQLASPWGLTLGVRGRIFVVDYLNNRVQMLRIM
jgi:DNA-binding beta-propeller fold protein YncE